MGIVSSVLERAEATRVMFRERSAHTWLAGWKRPHPWLMVLFLVAVACGCSRETPPEQEAQPSPLLVAGESIWLRHILVQYAGAYGAPAEVTRSRAQADSLCRSLRERVGRGEDFGELARQFSDDASASEGGKIAALSPGDAPPAFEQVAVSLAPGEMSDVFETTYGFHFMQRLDTSTCKAQHILIAYKGAQNASATVTRTRDEALERAQRILAEVNNPNVGFAVAARNYSDDTTASSGGALPTFRRDGPMHPDFTDAAFKLREGEISGVVETPFGFHIIRRVEDKTIRVAHILVSYNTGEMGETSRSRDDALKRAFDVLFRARQGEDFAALALEYSDDARNNKTGGRLAPIRIGVMVPEFEDAAFRLRPGEISDVVETNYGFHIIKRLY